MKKPVYRLLVIFLLLFSVKAFSADSITVITEAWPPYVIDIHGKPSGFDYEIMMNVFKSMDIKVEFKFYPWKRCLLMIKNKKADAILCASKTIKRENFMFFPEEHLSESNSVIIYTKERPLEFTDLNSLSGKVIGTTPGYFYSDEFNNATNFTKEPVKDFSSNFKKLMAGHIDGFVINKNVGLYEAQNLKILNKIAYTEKYVTGGLNYLAFSKKPENSQLSKNFSEALKKYKETEEYKAILKKYGQ